MGAISKNTKSSAENSHLPWTQILKSTRCRFSTPIPSLPNLDSGTLFPSTKRLTRPPVKSSNATKFLRNTQVQSRIMVSGFDTTLDQLPKTCTENTEMSLWPVPSLKCTEMAARHRARPGSIQILKTARVEAKDCRRPQNQAMQKPDIKFPLPRRVISKKQQTARKFNTSRPTTVY